MFTLNYRDARPIYEQIKDNFRTLIVSGVLTEDEKLPSVRSLATSLAVNPNTIQRAYRELEAEGYLYSVPGKGSFVNPSAGANNARKKSLMAECKSIIAELRLLGATTKELKALLEEEQTHD